MWTRKDTCSVRCRSCNSMFSSVRMSVLLWFAAWSLPASKYPVQHTGDLHAGPARYGPQCVQQKGTRLFLWVSSTSIAFEREWQRQIKRRKTRWRICTAVPDESDGQLHIWHDWLIRFVDCKAIYVFSCSLSALDKRKDGMRQLRSHPGEEKRSKKKKEEEKRPLRHMHGHLGSQRGVNTGPSSSSENVPTSVTLSRLCTKLLLSCTCFAEQDSCPVFEHLRWEFLVNPFVLTPIQSHVIYQDSHFSMMTLQSNSGVLHWWQNWVLGFFCFLFRLTVIPGLIYNWVT